MTFDERFTGYLAGRISQCAAESENLRADSRSDEADFARIRKNVYDIFLTVFKTALRTCADHEGALGFFTEKLEQIPSNWRTAHEQAVLHEDAAREHTEFLKLETLEDIKETFETLRREQHD